MIDKVMKIEKTKPDSQLKKAKRKPKKTVKAKTPKGE
jgi:hypothetical protein